jgi:hypothetical protein
VLNAHSLDALLSPSAMRLAMGEMTREELVAAQETVREVLGDLENQASWSVGEREPPEGLFQSMAVRLDHGLGLDGYYDQFGAEPGTHARRLEEAVALAKTVHASIVRHAPSFPSDQIEALQKKYARTDLRPSDPIRLTSTAAVRYALTNAERYGLVLLPRQAPEALMESVLASVEWKGGDYPEAGLDWARADVRRLYEETVGTGFFHADWSMGNLGKPRGPKP